MEASMEKDVIEKENPNWKDLSKDWPIFKEV